MSKSYINTIFAALPSYWQPKDYDLLSDNPPKGELPRDHPLPSERHKRGHHLWTEAV